MHYENCSMKNALTASAKSFLALSGLTEAGSATDVVFSEKSFWIRNEKINNFKRRNG